jgi:hypothetical protein
MASKLNTARLTAACAALCATLVAPLAWAAPVINVETTDQIYGSYSGSVLSGAVGAAATLTWRSAGYYWGGDIGLTDAFGTIVADITTNFDDTYHLYAAGSGFATLGSSCVAGAHTECVALSGTAQSLLPEVNALNGGSGICCGASDIVIVGEASDVPEPGSMLLAGTAIAGLLVSSRRRNAAVAVKA